MKRKTISLIFIVLAFSMLSAIPVNACPFEGKTSLEVWKEIDDVEVNGNSVTVTGTIYIQNDNTYYAYIKWVTDSVEGKAKKQPWTVIGSPKTIKSSFYIDPGEKYELPFSITFTNGGYKAYRNVVRVALHDHERGDSLENRYFKYRKSFKLPPFF